MPENVKLQFQSLLDCLQKSWTPSTVSIPVEFKEKLIIQRQIFEKTYKQRSPILFGGP
jgi:hypothetical protein